MNLLFSKKEATTVVLKHKDISEFAEIYEHYKDRIFRYIRFRVSTIEEAEDLTSQTFLRAIESFAKYQDQGRGIAGWLYKIATNLVRDWYRKKKPILFAEIRGKAESTISPNLNQKIDEKIRQKQLIFCLNQLKEKEQQVIILKIFEELTFKEIADALNKKESAVKMLYYRSLNKLKKITKKQFLSLEL